jgi:hypothetical protein
MFPQAVLNTGPQLVATWGSSGSISRDVIVRGRI